MKPVVMLITDWCPYCKRAAAWMKELEKENPNFSQVEIRVIDEGKEPELAKKYDYYYVPTYYVGDMKVHEGVPTKDIVRSVYEKSLE